MTFMFEKSELAQLKDIRTCCEPQQKLRDMVINVVWQPLSWQGLDTLS